MDLMVSVKQSKGYVAAAAAPESWYAGLVVYHSQDNPNTRIDSPKHVVTQHNKTLFLNHMIAQGSLKLVVRWKGKVTLLHAVTQGPRLTMALLVSIHDFQECPCCLHSS